MRLLKIILSFLFVICVLVAVVGLIVSIAMPLAIAKEHNIALTPTEIRSIGAGLAAMFSGSVFAFCAWLLRSVVPIDGID